MSADFTMNALIIPPTLLKKNHINGIENFWSQAKRILRKYNGIHKSSFPLFLKEGEFHFNYGTPKQQLKTLRT